MRTNQHEDTTPQRVGRAGRPVLSQRSRWKVSRVQRIGGYSGQFFPWLVNVQLCLLMTAVTTELNVELLEGEIYTMFYRSNHNFFTQIHFSLKIKCPKPLNTNSVFIQLLTYITEIPNRKSSNDKKGD